jgi:hypothetical protein
MNGKGRKWTIKKDCFSSVESIQEWHIHVGNDIT